MATATPMPGRAPRNSRPRILLIDGNPVFRAAVAGFLHRRGFDMVGVASGEEGLPALPSFGPSLCILDLIPAGRMTGVQAAEALHARDGSLRFVFLGGCLEPAWAERPAFLRSAPLLRKPVELEELVALVWRTLAPVAVEGEPPLEPQPRAISGERRPRRGERGGEKRG